jgi:hypothetical protein
MGYTPEQMVDEAIARMAEGAFRAGMLPRTLTGVAIGKMANFATGIGQG